MSSVRRCLSPVVMSLDWARGFTASALAALGAGVAGLASDFSAGFAAGLVAAPKPFSRSTWIAAAGIFANSPAWGTVRRAGALPLASRLALSSSSLTAADFTPSAGTSTLAAQTIAFRASLRKPSIAQLRW